jgi:hypothetical protein
VPQAPANHASHSAPPSASPRRQASRRSASGASSLASSAFIRHAGVATERQLARFTRDLLGDRCAGDAGKELVEPFGIRARVFVLGQLVEPRHVREQQPRVVAPLGADDLAAEPDFLLDPFDRARASTRRRSRTRAPERPPRAREQRVAPRRR